MDLPSWILTRRIVTKIGKQEKIDFGEELGLVSADLDVFRR